MKISLFQGVLIGVFGLGALLGIIVFATYSSRATSNGIGTVVIWGTLPASEVDAALSASTRTDSKLKNVSYVEKDASALPTDLASAIATGAPPNLVLDSQENLLSLAPLITPIPYSTLPPGTFQSAFASEDNIFAAPNNAGYYGVPYVIDPLMLYANDALLSSAGVAEIPSTWEALEGLAPNVATFTANRQITGALIALGTYANVHDARAILSTLFLQAGVPIMSVSTTGVIAPDLGVNAAGADGIPAGDAVVDFYTQFADPSEVSYTWNASLPDSQQAFIAGDSALYLGFASEAGFIASANPHLTFTVVPVPEPATATTKTTYGLAYAFMIPRGAKNASGAYQAAVLLAGNAEQVAAASATGIAPASRIVLAAPPADPTVEAVYASALYAQGWLSPAPASVDPVFSGMINSVISGQLTVSAALSSAGLSLGAAL